jgi:periplasmic protein CpxP/Spy
MKRKLLALIAAAGLAGLALTASAQMPWHGMHDPVAMLQRMQAKLNLNTSQQLQWQTAIAQSNAAREVIRANFKQLKDATKLELGKDDPDLASLASLSDQVQQQNIDERKKARAAWLAVYANLTPDQKVIVRDTISARLARMESFHQRLHERLSGG